MMVRTVALSMLLISQACLAAPVYKVVGPDGRVSYTDQPPDPVEAKALRGTGAAGSGPAGNLFDPATAATRAQVNQSIVEAATYFCTHYAPQTARDVNLAHAAWRQRNALLVEKANLILRDTDGEDVMSELANENENMLERLREAPIEEKLRWCWAAPANFGNPTLDPSRNAAVVRTIMNYKPKKR